MGKYKGFDKQEFAKEGKRIYRQKYAKKLEPTEKGRIIAIEIESGDSFIGDSTVEAILKAKEKYPNRIFYKAQMFGITVDKIDEKYTSQTCCKCGLRKKSNRKTRGLYLCDCGNKINADRNGANNILKRYLRYRSSGSVALPVATLVLQRTDAHCLRIYSKHSVAH